MKNVEQHTDLSGDRVIPGSHEGSANGESVVQENNCETVNLIVESNQETSPTGEIASADETVSTANTQHDDNLRYYRAHRSRSNTIFDDFSIMHLNLANNSSTESTSVICQR